MICWGRRELNIARPPLQSVKYQQGDIVMKVLASSRSSKILERVVEPLSGHLSKPVAKSLLSLQFSDEDHDRMESLVNKSKRNKLTASERAELTEYVQLGFLLDKLHAKALIALKKRSAL